MSLIKLWCLCRSWKSCISKKVKSCGLCRLLLSLLGWCIKIVGKDINHCTFFLFILRLIPIRCIRFRWILKKLFSSSKRIFFKDRLLFILIFIRIDLRSSRRCFDRFNLLVYSFWLSLRLLNWWTELLKLLRYFLRHNVWYSLRLLNRLGLLLRLPTSNFLLRRYFNLNTFRHF